MKEKNENLQHSTFSSAESAQSRTPSQSLVRSTHLGPPVEDPWGQRNLLSGQPMSVQLASSELSAQSAKPSQRHRLGKQSPLSHRNWPLWQAGKSAQKFETEKIFIFRSIFSRWVNSYESWPVGNRTHDSFKAPSPYRKIEKQKKTNGIEVLDSLQSTSSEPSAQSDRWSHLRLVSKQPWPLAHRNLSKVQDVTLVAKLQPFSSAPSRQSRKPSHFFSAGKQIPLEHLKSFVWQFR